MAIRGLIKYLCCIFMISDVAVLSSGTKQDLCPSDPVDTQCQLTLEKDPNLETKLCQWDEYQPHMVEYTIRFNQWDPWDVDNWADEYTNNVFMPQNYKHIFTKHGENLLLLPFNYKQLSMQGLSFGVDVFNLWVEDSPKYCFQNLTSTVKLARTNEFFLKTFLNETWRSENTISKNEERKTCIKMPEKICRQILLDIWDGYECCGLNLRNGSTNCSTIDCEIVDLLSTKHNWALVVVLPVGLSYFYFLLFGPVHLLSLYKGQSFAFVQYIVDLAEPIQFNFRKENESTSLKTKQTIKKKKVKPSIESINYCNKTTGSRSLHSKPIRRLTKIIRNLPLTQTVSYPINKLYIQVDQRMLMTENQISIGPLSYFWEHFILCKISRYSPFKTCCSAFIFGSCLAKCCHKKCTSLFTWYKLFRVIGMLLSIFIVSIPNIVYVIIFELGVGYSYSDRAVAMRKNGKGSNSVWLGESSDEIIEKADNLLNVYYASAVTLYILYEISPIRFNNFVLNILNDMKHINRSQCLRPFLANFLLPFELLGMLGIIFGPIYWFLIMPILLFQTIFYCIPTVYLFCRLVFYRVPDCCQCLSKVFCNACAVLRASCNRYKTSRKGKAYLASKYISPTINETSEFIPLSTKGDWSNKSRLDYPWYIRIIVGIVASIVMITLLLMYADCFKLVIQVVVVTFLGALVNINSTGNYFMFAFFMITYILQVFGNIKRRYRQLSTAVFELIKNTLNDDVERIVSLNASEQNNMAFKYFNPENIKLMVNIRKEAYQLNHMKIEEPNWAEELNKYNTSSEIVNNQLNWKIYHLILFLDKNDVPRIPRRLFRKFINLRLRGCPGPVYTNLLNAAKHLGMMTLFLVFVFVIVRAFRDEVSSLNQLVVTLVGGFIPFILQMILKPKLPKLDLSTYAFKGVINDIICEYNDTFPIIDIGIAADADNQSFRSSGEEYNLNKIPCATKCDTVKPPLIDSEVKETENVPEDVVNVALNENELVVKVRRFEDENTSWFDFIRNIF